MKHRCNDCNLDFKSQEEKEDHIVKSHEMPKNPNAENMKKILDKNAKSKHRTTARAIRGSKK